jgi:4a-hydroxytetrahydrobiopterin dehydratase
MQLDKIKCTPCQGGIPPMKPAEAEQHLVQVPGWSLEENASKIKRTFKFDNFVDALAFTNHVGALCEDEGHHADIQLGWGYVKVYFQTHKIEGLHLNDFVMAAKVNQLAH